jgi:L,D-transpeptidase ErfK/SrfK
MILAPAARHLLVAAARPLALILAMGASALPAEASMYALPKEGNMVGEMRVVTASAASTLLDIARHYDLGTEEIAGANPGVDMWVPKPGQRVVLPTIYILPPKPWTGLVVNVGARRLYYFPTPSRGEAPVVITYPLGIARDNWPTPIGMTRIAAKVRNPSWVVPKDILEEHVKNGNPLPKVVPPGPENPMGLLALRTAMEGIYIHGTSEPWGVGDRVSHGCMHLYPEDVAEIFPRIPVGAPVRIIDQPFQVGERDGVLYMAGYEPLADYHNPKSPEQRAVDAVTSYQGKHTLLIDWGVVKKIAKDETTVPLPIMPGAPDMAPFIASLPAQPYSFPPYGVDANSAAPPKRQLPVATAPEANSGEAPLSDATNATNPPPSGQQAAPPESQAATSAQQPVANAVLEPNAAPASAPVRKGPSMPAAAAPANVLHAAQPENAARETHGATGSPATAPAATDPSMAGTAASAPANPEGIY